MDIVFTRKQRLGLLWGCIASVVLAFILIVVGLNLNSDALVAWATPYRTTARQGYVEKYLGTVKRQVPTTTSNEGLVNRYPTYGVTDTSYTTAEKDALITESCLLNTSDTSSLGIYSYFDRDGYLRDSAGAQVTGASGAKKLYRHTASTSMYYAGTDNFPVLSDQEPAVKKQITFAPRRQNKSYNVTGLYAPAGELVSVQVNATEFASVGSLTIYIGQCFYNGNNNNIWSAKDICRMPNVMNKLVLRSAYAETSADGRTLTFYVGSFLGGPIYVANTLKSVTLTFSGAVEYQHFVLGLTTPADYQRLAKSTAPYFDLEIWDNGVLHSGSYYYARSASYDQVFQSAILWEKISLLSGQVRDQGIAMTYDPFIAAGAAVAFVGAYSTDCPASWLANVLNVESFTRSGAWGTIHEYNHHFQGWGLPGDGEVTNNALSLASYAAFTKISSLRTLSPSAGDSGLGWWESYTNASYALRRVLGGYYTDTQQLSIYATLLHNLGVENYVKVASTGKSGVDGYYTALAEQTGYDFTYYFRALCGLNPSPAVQATVAQSKKTAFIPVASIYQTGRSTRLADGRTVNITTMQPYEIPYGQNFTLDLRRYTEDGGNYQLGSVVVPADFNYQIVGVGNPAYGRLEKTKTSQVYTYHPDANHPDSGTFNVTLKLHYTGNSYQIPDQVVTLCLNLRQSHEFNKTLLERTVYRYDSAKYADATEAWTANFAGYTKKTVANNVNTTQNSNTDIWLTSSEYNTYGANSILVVSGKLYVDNSGDYLLALRGRENVALYYQDPVDNQWKLGGKITGNTNGYNGWWDGSDARKADTPSTYTRLTNLRAGQWLNFREVLLLKKSGGALPFTGLGWSAIEYDTSGAVDGDGHVVGQPTPTWTLSYATAYRSSYRFPENKFTSDYVFRREVKSDGALINHQRGQLVAVSGYTPWSDNEKIDNLFDGNDNNYIHNAAGVAHDITPSQPFQLTVDFGQNLFINTLTIYGRTSGSPVAGYTLKDYLPKNFVLYGGTQKNALVKLADQTTAKLDGSNLVVTFPAGEVRYYRLVVTETNIKTVGKRYLAFRYIEGSYQLGLGVARQFAPDDARFSYRGAWQVKSQVSSFGRVYVGAPQASLLFKFTGTQVGLIGYRTPTSGAVCVYLDGRLVARVNLQGTSGQSMIYLSPRLSSGTHVVTVTGAGQFSLDSALVWGYN